MKIVIFDTETTGLLQPINSPLEVQPKIIEFYGVALDKEFNILEEVNHLINPGEPISPTIKRITGIDDKMLIGKPNFSEISASIVELIHGSNLAVAHNIAFDNGMLECDFKRIPMDRPKAKHDLCIVEATMGMTGHRLSLTRLHWILFQKQFKAHRAKDDVYALVRCFHELTERGIINLEHYTD